MTLVAYLDPGSGSLIAATAAAGLAGVSVAAKSIWQRKTLRFRKSAAGAEVDAVESQEGTDGEELSESGDDA